LQTFQTDQNLAIPSHLKTTQDKADWIHKEHMEKWVKWRAEQVTKQVQEIREVLKETDPKKMLSAAVFQNVEKAIQTVGQDWTSWVKEGLLDFVNPMVYWVPPETVGQRTADYLKRTEGRCPIYPGILTSTDFNVPVENVEKYVQGIRGAGGQGITLFCYATWSNEHRGERGLETIQDYDEALKEVFKEKAERPHSRTKT
ncbi:MAG: family 10 glycosylhydrolase, partial [Candidatus Bathyarchaeia archaeon]